MRLRPVFDFPSSRPDGRGRRRRRRPAPPCLRLESLEHRTLLSFAAPVGYATGSYPAAVLTADFNGDGRLDIATANGSNDVSILLGNGDGSFQAARNASTGTAGAGPRSLAVGDFNNDGKLDLATANDAGASVSVLLGNGDGSFQPAQNLTTGGDTPEAVAVGDFNGDGKLDLAVTGYSPGSSYYDPYTGTWYGTSPSSDVTVLLGHGDGTFAANVTRPLDGGDAPSVVAADVNSDGKADLLAGGDLLLGHGDGTFAAPSWIGVYGWMSAADLNGDGKLDAVGDGLIALGNGDGTFQAARSYGNFRTLTVADFNGDHNPDLVINSTDAIGVLLGNGDGSFRGPEYSAAGPTPIGAAAGDFNADGRPDLAVADNSAGASVLINTGDWRSLLAGGFPTATTAGQTHSFTVTALADDGSPLTGYTGTVHFTSTDPQAVLPADYTFTAADGGTHTFAVALKTAGWGYAITVADTSSATLSGSQGDIAVNPADVSTFRVDGFPSPFEAGAYAGDFTVNAYDAYGNLATNYTGTVHFTSTDPQAVLPADYTFTANDSGTATFSATLNTVGTQSVTVTDTAHPAVTGAQAGLQVIPVATISGPQGGFPNQALTYTLGAASGLPAGTTFTYAIDWNGDGAVDQTITGPDGTAVTHSYAGSGNYTIGMTATAHLGTGDYTSYERYLGVHITAISVAVQADPGDSTKSALVVQGTAGGDNLAFSPGPGTSVVVSDGGYTVGTFSAPGGAAFAHLLVYGYGGNDAIYIWGGLAVPALVFGGDGNDFLSASGSTANNVLIGGAGNDTIYGGSGRDLVIGGLGSDTLHGGGGDDILIGGYTDYDANITALLAVMAEWGRTDADYGTRVKHLSGSLRGGLNGSYVLTKTTVHNDNAVDSLYGEAGADWFIVSGKGKSGDRVNDAASGEVITTV